MTPSPLPEEVQEIIDTSPCKVLVRGATGSGKTLFVATVAQRFDATVVVSADMSGNGDEIPAPWNACNDRVTITRVSPSGDGSHLVDLGPRLVETVKLMAKGDEKCMIVIDDIEGITGDADVTAALASFPSSFNGIIVVISSGVHGVFRESIFDAIIELQDCNRDRRPFRTLELVKVRGTPRKVRSHPFTLLGGRATFFRPVPRVEMDASPSWVAMPDKRGTFSSGSPSLDAMLHGGFAMGSFNVIEMAPIPLDRASYLLMNPLLNFLAMGRGVIVSMTAGVNSSLLNKKDFMTFVDPELINENFRILDEKTMHIAEARPYVVQLSKREKEIFRVFPEVYDTLALKTNYQPVLSVFEFTPVDFANSDIYKEFFSHVKFVKNSNLTEIAIVNSGFGEEIKSTLAHVSDVYVKMTGYNDLLFIAGEKPWTNHHAMRLEKPNCPRIFVNEML